MNASRKSQLALLSMASLCTGLAAQAAQWKTETTDNGAITVKTNISSRKDESGSSVPLIEYVATTTTDNVSMERYISVVKDVSKHKAILNEKDVRLLNTVSDNEWLVYYYFDTPWPVPDADVVAKMVLAQDVAEKKSVFTLTAAPTLFKKTSVKRPCGTSWRRNSSSPSLPTKKSSALSTSPTRSMVCR